MINRYLLAILLLPFATSFPSVYAKVGTKSVAISTEQLKLDSIYRKAQRKFQKGNYKEARPLLEKYLEKSRKTKYKRERLFWVIDQIGRIYLRVDRNPDEAIRFFEKLILKDSRLSDDEEDDIAAWITAAKDWKKFGVKNPDNLSNRDLFKAGQNFYNRALKKQEFPADDKGDADFSIAASYLIPFIVNNDSSQNIGEALYLMGHIRHILRTDPEYWNENYYLKEAIRRYPHTRLAQKSWELLEIDVRSGYTGSSGDHTPPSMVAMLNRYKKLAFSSKKKKVRKG